MVAPVVDLTARGLWSKKFFPVSGIPTQLLVLHSAECPLQGGYAVSLTNWFSATQYPAYPEASWQRFVDPIARVRAIPDELGAWHASEANGLSIGWEQAGYARFTRAEWLTAAGKVQLDNLAYDMAEVAIRDGIPPVWLTDSQVRAVLDNGNRAIKGFCTHRQIDPETRTDPGDGYPYDLLMERIKHYMKQDPAPAGPDERTDMALSDGDWRKGAGVILNTNVQEYKTDGKTPAGVKKAAFILGNLNQWFTRVLDGQEAARLDRQAIHEKLDTLLAASKQVGK
jgi:hypothetical protein